jgi:hypothetical protein
MSANTDKSFFIVSEGRVSLCQNPHYVFDDIDWDSEILVVAESEDEALDLAELYDEGKLERVNYPYLNSTIVVVQNKWR